MREIFFFISKFIKIKPVKLHVDISFFLILGVRVFCLCVCLCTRCLPNLLSPERVSDPWSSSRGLGASQPGGFGIHVSISNIYVLFAVGRFLRIRLTKDPGLFGIFCLLSFPFVPFWFWQVLLYHGSFLTVVWKNRYS